MTRIKVLAGIGVLALVTSACAQPAPPPPPPDTRAADEAAIRAASAQWLAAGQAKDAARFTSFFTSDAVLMFHGTPPVKGKQALDGVGVEMMKDPAFAITWKTTKVDVARSGELGYELGTWEMTHTDMATKKPATTSGEFVTVWKKQADGSWKAAVDVPVEGAPPSSAGSD